MAQNTAQRPPTPRPPTQSPPQKKPQKKSSPLRQKILSGIGWALCVVFGLLLVCNLTIIIKGTIFPDAPPSVLGITPMVTLSGSMSGEQDGHIEIGDLIFVGKADPEELQAGDVISFMEGSIVVTHRILEVKDAGDGTKMWITKGDANNAPDTLPVYEEALVGKYLTRIPKLGDLALFLQQPLGMVVFVGIPVLGFIIYDIIRRQREAALESKKRAAMMAEIKRLRAQNGEQTPPKNSK